MHFLFLILLFLISWPALASNAEPPSREELYAKYKWPAWCEGEFSDPAPIEEWRLSPKKKLLKVTCFSTAYQTVSLVVYIDETKKPAKAEVIFFPTVWPLDERATVGVREPLIVEPYFDPVKKTIASRSKGRALGDCGNYIVYDLSKNPVLPTVKEMRSQKCQDDLNDEEMLYWQDPDNWPRARFPAFVHTQPCRSSETLKMEPKQKERVLIFSGFLGERNNAEEGELRYMRGSIPVHLKLVENAKELWSGSYYYRNSKECLRVAGGNHSYHEKNGQGYQVELVEVDAKNQVTGHWMIRPLGNGLWEGEWEPYASLLPMSSDALSLSSRKDVELRPIWGNKLGGKNISGRWERVESDPDKANISFFVDEKGEVSFFGNSVYVSKEPDALERDMVNVGDIYGRVPLKQLFNTWLDGFSGRPASLEDEPEVPYCRVKFKLIGSKLKVEEEGRCGGMNVSFYGEYVRKSLLAE